MQAQWSPTVYVNGKLVCYWDIEGDTDCLNVFGDADGLAKWLCKQEGFASLPECE